MTSQSRNAKKSSNIKVVIITIRLKPSDILRNLKRTKRSPKRSDRSSTYGIANAKFVRQLFFFFFFK